jgi:hypothetical protein
VKWSVVDENQWQIQDFDVREPSQGWLYFLWGRTILEYLSNENPMTDQHEMHKKVILKGCFAELLHVSDMHAEDSITISPCVLPFSGSRLHLTVQPI